jgi:hypothetical protein
MAQKIKQLAELLPLLQGWTIETYAAHNEAMRESDIRFHVERDRRYAEAATLNAVALKIKETADLAALQLARESQSLKELQNDALRDKTLSESGIYATNAGVAQAIGDLKTSLQPLVDYVSDHRGAELTKGNLYAGAAGVAAFLGALYYIIH